jgi:hypothetical protein
VVGPQQAMELAAGAPVIRPAPPGSSPVSASR